MNVIMLVLTVQLEDTTKMIPELRDLSYESRLLQCGLTPLETKRRPNRSV